MKYYAMETEDGATLYFDGHGGAIVDIDIPDGVETITFSAENEFGGQYQCVYLKSVLKQFPDVKEIKIKPSICSIEIANEMFPNVQMVTSENTHFQSGPLLMHRHSSTQDKYTLYNTFCQKPGSVIDLKNVNQINGYAFSGCMSTTVVNSNKIDYIEDKAFAGSLFVMPSYKEPIVMAGSVLANINPNAPEIYIGDAISYISRYADFSNVKVIHLDRFKSINKLFSPSCPDGCELFIDEVEKTSVYDFTKCYKQNYNGYNFSAFHINKENPYYKTVDGILYSKDGKSLILCPRGKDGTVDIPDGTEYICEKAFSRSRISAIKLPDSLKEIGPFAFDCCENLANIDFGHGIRYIGSESSSNIFRSCVSIEKVDIPSQVESIGNRLFLNCRNLKEIIVHNGLISIGELAFADTKVERLSIPTTVERIGVSAMSEVKDIKIAKGGNPFGLICAVTKDPSLESNAEKLSDIVKIEYEGEGDLYLPKYMTNEGINKVSSEISVYGYSDAFAGHTYEMGVASDVKQNIAIQIYQYTKDSGIASYLKRVSTSISKRLLKDGMEEALIGFIKTGLMTKNALKNTLKEANKINATSVSAYILSMMDEDSSKTSFRL